MINFLRKLLKPKYETLNTIKIDAKKILANFNYLNKRQGSAELFPVLKSNAYGHGLREMCLILNKTTAPMVAVDSFPEAQIAWKNFKRKVLILAEMPLRAYDYCHLGKTEFVVYNDKTLKHLARYKKRAKIHLFFNSGMNREGIKDMASFISSNKPYLDAVDVVGFCSHLSSAEENSVFNQEQENKFFQGLMTLREAGYFPTWIHLGNSAAALTLENTLLTAYRPGLALYGYDPINGDDDNLKVSYNSQLQPALQLFSTIVFIQNLGPDEVVSYNASYRTTQETNIGIIPFGYFEGLDRRLSNKGEFCVVHPQKNIWVKIAGKVCMNMTCLDLGQNDVYKGDQVMIISDQKNHPNSAHSLAEIMGTIPYEVLVKLQPSIRREIIW